MSCAALAGLALSAAGAGVGAYSSHEAKQNMNDVLQQQLAQQKKFQGQGNQVFQESLGKSTPKAVNQDLASGQNQFLNAASQAQAVPLGLPNAATTNEDSSASKARAGLGAKALSDFAGYSNIGQQQYLKDLDASSRLGVINNQAGQTASLLGPELQNAQNSMSGLSAFGNLLGSAGGLVGAFGSMPTKVPVMTQNYMQYPGTASMLNNIFANNNLDGLGSLGGYNFNFN